MLPEIEAIARRRRQLGLKQKDLSRLAGVSQSFIAKLEAGKINPSYSKIKSILESFDMLEHQNSTKAGDVMNRKIISVASSEKVSEAVRKMRRSKISQLPVLSGEIVSGTISEKTVVEQIGKRRNIREIFRLPVSEIMEEAYPQIPDTTPVKAIAALLNHNDAVLVTRRGKLSGIITKSDLLRI